jgi:DNA-binding NarL/FixJ family response regulator
VSPRDAASPLRILLASHQPIIRSGLRILLERESEFRVVAEAANGWEAIVLADYKHPDVALLDMKLPLVNGLEVAKHISKKDDRPKLVFVTAHTDQSYVNEAFKAGVRGYVDGDSAAIDLIRAIRIVIRDRFFLSPAICARLFDKHLSSGKISVYERDLWCLIASGYDEEEIAALWNVDLNKVRLDAQSPKSMFCWNSLPEAMRESVFTAQPRIR